MNMLLIVIGFGVLLVAMWKCVAGYRMADELDKEWQRRVDRKREQCAKRLNEKGGKFYGD